MPDDSFTKNTFVEKKTSQIRSARLICWMTRHSSAFPCSPVFQTACCSVNRCQPSQPHMLHTVKGHLKPVTSQLFLFHGWSVLLCVCFCVGVSGYIAQSMCSVLQESVRYFADTGAKNSLVQSVHCLLDPGKKKKESYSDKPDPIK